MLAQLVEKFADQTALTEVANDTHRPLNIVTGWGEPASAFITRQYSPWFIDPGQIHEEIATALGLDNYPVTRRDLGGPSRRLSHRR